MSSLPFFPIPKMQDLQSSSSFSSTMTSLFKRALSKRRTWASLFLLTYFLLLSSSRNVILSIRSVYNSAILISSAYSPWPALYASLLYGAVFGLLSMAAALAVAVPATVVTWITVLVLLAFAGKRRATLVVEGRGITCDIVSLAFRILVREGNFVAAVCAVVSFVALLVWRRGQLMEGRGCNGNFIVVCDGEMDL